MSKKAALLGVLAVLVTACSHAYHEPTVPQVNAHRLANLYELAARDTRCPIEGLSSARVGDRVWQLRGCGQTREYAIFPRGPGARWQRIAPVGERASNELACPAIATQIDAEGMVSAAGCGQAATYQLQCGRDRCEWVMVTRAVTRPAVEVTRPSEGAPAGTIIVVPDTRPVDPAIDSALRSALDAQRSAVLGCGAGGAVIRARWDGDGVVSLSLDPPWAGTERERCVRSSLPVYRVNADTPGEIAHVVR